MIEILNVTKTYNNINNAVEELKLTINNGEIFGFLGPNGAGKTTTIKMITGIIEPTNGDIKINGISVRENPLKAKRQFAYVPDSPDMFLKFKGIEYLNFMADVYEIPKEKRKAMIIAIIFTYSHPLPFLLFKVPLVPYPVFKNALVNNNTLFIFCHLQKHFF